MWSFLLLVTCREGEWLWHKSPFHPPSDLWKQLCVFISQWFTGKMPIFYFQSVLNKKRLMVHKIHWRKEIEQFLLEFWTGWGEKRKMEGLEDFRFAVEGIGLVRVRSNLTITSSFHNFYLTLKLLFVKCLKGHKYLSVTLWQPAMACLLFQKWWSESVSEWHYHETYWAAMVGETDDR